MRVACASRSNFLRFVINTTCLILFLVGAGNAALGAQNPELAAHVGEGDDATEKSKALAINRLDIDVEITGDTARTVVTASFANSGHAVLEGNFAFDLPSGSVVTGYALDVKDKMVDGVLVGRRQAKLAYEARVQRGIDPGLAEVTRTGAFTTRIFPILPDKGRTVRLEFVTPIDPQAPFVIPLATEQPVGSVSIHVRATGISEDAHLMAPEGLDLRWTHDKGGLEAQARAANRRLSGALSVGPLAPARRLRLSRHSSGDTFFEIDDLAPANTEPHVHPTRLRVYWDSSRSRGDRNLTSEIDLLGAYVAAVHPQTLDLVLFADIEPLVRTFQAPSASDIEAALKTVEYRGATSMKPVLKAELPEADTCLLFSDGNITIDSYRPERMPCALFAISSARDANRGFLGALARRSAGDFVDLNSHSPEAALKILQRRVPRVIDVTDDEGRELDYTVLAANEDRFRVIGRLPAQGNIVVKLSRATQKTRSYAVDRSDIRPDNTIAALWAAQRIGELDATDRPDHDQMLAMARRYSVAGAAADFVVFESVEDYANAGIEPPNSFGPEALKRFQAMMDDSKKEKTAQQAERLSEIIAMWAEEKEWWRTEFKPTPIQKPKNPAQAHQAPPAPNMSVPPPAPPPPPPPRVTARNMAGIGADIQTVVVTAEKRADGPSSEPIIEVTIAPWNPDRPYLAALKAAGPDTFWSVYRAQEREHGASPAFYLDVAEYLFRHGQTPDAIKVVLNALDLPAADTTTLTILADRLMRYGDETRALWLYERIIYLEPDRPQPKRNLAIALIERAEQSAKRGGPAAAQRADYARALSLLNDVVTHDWNSAFDGIEIISLMEANHIVPRLRQLGDNDIPLDPRLIALLDVDLRVVLEWNTDETDMDLWVDEPTGERAIYDNPKTAIGGRLSNDMTNGYGPEEYLVHRAPNGTYTVRVNVYATDRLNPNGATNVRAHVFRNYGRPGEQEQLLELELKRADKDAHLIGTVKVDTGR